MTDAEKLAYLLKHGAVVAMDRYFERVAGDGFVSTVACYAVRDGDITLFSMADLDTLLGDFFMSTERCKVKLSFALTGANNDMFSADLNWHDVPYTEAVKIEYMVKSILDELQTWGLESAGLNESDLAAIKRPPPMASPGGTD